MLINHFPAMFAALVSTGGLVLIPTLAFAQTYQVDVEESGALPTVYTKRNNWRILPDFRHTTMIAKPGASTLCNESPCLDDDSAGGGEPPDLTRGGTATAMVPGMSPGLYRFELRYNQTVNRSTSVPWSITTDGNGNNTRSGTLNQRATAPGASNWLVLGDSDQNPIAVQSTATFLFGSDTITFDGSLSYGGVRLVRVEDVTPADAGDAGGSPACAELRSIEYSDAEAALSVDLGSTERLSFTIENVPDPAGLDHAALSMWLRDADHPGQEGTVFVNGAGPLQLPADTSWNDVTAQAVLPIPVAYLHAGDNVVELGAGSLAATNYAVSRVALNVEGAACAVGSDAAVPHDAATEHDDWQPVDAGSGGTTGGDASTGPTADGSAGAGALGSAEAPGDDAGCACSLGERPGSFAAWFWLVLPAALGMRRRSCATASQRSRRRPMASAANGRRRSSRCRTSARYR